MYGYMPSLVTPFDGITLAMNFSLATVVTDGSSLITFDMALLARQASGFHPAKGLGNVNWWLLLSILSGGHARFIVAVNAISSS